MVEWRFALAIAGMVFGAGLLLYVVANSLAAIYRRDARLQRLEAACKRGTWLRRDGDDSVTVMCPCGHHEQVIHVAPKPPGTTVWRPVDALWEKAAP